MTEGAQILVAVASIVMALASVAISIWRRDR
jgi:hypothetical protein